MPELPEVETVRRRLEPVLCGRRLERVRILDDRLTHPEAAAAVAKRLEGEQVIGVSRRGKYLIFGLSSGAHLLVHLRMTGSFRCGENGLAAADPHRRAVVRLDDGSDVAFRDVRRFGTWTLLGPEELEPYLDARLGPEPLEASFTARSLRTALSVRRCPVKSALLDQRVAAGVGNIYADEALWHARIAPRRRSGTLTAEETRRLARSIRSVLRRGIARQGATVRDYRDPAGEAGSMQNELSVYGQAGEPCPRCATSIERIVLSGRGTWFCPACQR
ncbi:MAG: DNA-formamidopyrimidine glycosylase [Gaiellales bacterium]